MAAAARKRAQSATASRHKRKGMVLRLTVWAGMAIVLSSGVLASYWHLSDPKNFALRDIKVIGELRHLDAAQLQSAVAESVDGNFFTVDMQAVRARVRALPWVSQATVSRSWPRGLSIRVVEHLPVARWGGDGYINAFGELFRPGYGPDLKHLVRLYGRDRNAAQVIDMYRAAVRLVEPLGLTISSLGTDERQAWIVVFDDGGLRLALGRSDVLMRLRRFADVYPQLLADSSRRPERVDARYAQGMAVTWRMVATEDRAHTAALRKKQGGAA